MSVIQVSNPRTDNTPKTFLAVDQGIGVGTLYVKNAVGAGAQWALQVGATGEETAEIVLLNSSVPSGTQMVLAANTLYAHAADTPVFAIKYNQVIFQKSTAGTTVAATTISGGTVTISPDNTFTQFDDTSSASTDWYRTMFQNSALAVTTTQSDWFSPAGYSFYSLANITQRVRNKLWDSTYIKGDDSIHDWINEWRDQMANAVTSLNEDFALGSTAVAFGTSGLGTVTIADFDQPRRVWVTFDGVNNYQSTKASVNEYQPDETFTASHPYHSWIGDNIISVNPAGAGGTANILYYQFGTTMVNDTDNLPQPMRPYTDSFVNYALAQALFKDGKVPEYREMMNLVNTSRTGFVNKNANRDKTGPSYVKIVETVDGADGMPL